MFCPSHFHDVANDNFYVLYSVHTRLARPSYIFCVSYDIWHEQKKKQVVTSHVHLVTCSSRLTYFHWVKLTMLLHRKMLCYSKRLNIGHNRWPHLNNRSRWMVIALASECSPTAYQAQTQNCGSTHPIIAKLRREWSLHKLLPQLGCTTTYLLDCQYLGSRDYTLVHAHSVFSRETEGRWGNPHQSLLGWTLIKSWWSSKLNKDHIKEIS